jgi:hypothetical protein
MLCCSLFESYFAAVFFFFSSSSSSFCRFVYAGETLVASMLVVYGSDLPAPISHEQTSSQKHAHARARTHPHSQ